MSWSLSAPQPQPWHKGNPMFPLRATNAGHPTQPSEFLRLQRAVRLCHKAPETGAVQQAAAIRHEQSLYTVGLGYVLAKQDSPQPAPHPLRLQVVLGKCHVCTYVCVLALGQYEQLALSLGEGSSVSGSSAAGARGVIDQAPQQGELRVVNGGENSGLSVREGIVRRRASIKDIPSQCGGFARAHGGGRRIVVGDVVLPQISQGAG